MLSTGHNSWSSAYNLNRYVPTPNLLFKSIYYSLIFWGPFVFVFVDFYIYYYVYLLISSIMSYAYRIRSRVSGVIGDEGSGDRSRFGTESMYIDNFLLLHFLDYDYSDYSSILFFCLSFLTLGTGNFSSRNPNSIGVFFIQKVSFFNGLEALVNDDTLFLLYSRLPGA